MFETGMLSSLDKHSVIQMNSEHVFQGHTSNLVDFLTFHPLSEQLILTRVTWGCWNLSQQSWRERQRQKNTRYRSAICHRADMQKHLHAHSHNSFSNSLYMHIFGLWKETGSPCSNPQRDRENILQTERTLSHFSRD